MKNFIVITIITLCSIAACLVVVLVFTSSSESTKSPNDDVVYIAPVPDVVTVIDPAPDPEPDPEISGLSTPEMRADNTMEAYMQTPEFFELRDFYRGKADFYAESPKGWVPNEELSELYNQSVIYMLGYYSYESGLEIQYALQAYFGKNLVEVECTQIDTLFVKSIKQYAQIVSYKETSYYVWSHGFDGYLMEVK